MTAPLKPPGGIYWRAAIFAPFSIDIPVSIGMEANPWPHTEFDVSLPLQVGVDTPTNFTIRMPLFVTMLRRASAATEFDVSMSIHVGLEPFTDLTVALPCEVTMDVDAVVQGYHINTAVQRSLTI